LSTSVADDDHDVTQPDRGQVTQRDVEDGGLAGLADTVDRQQRLRQRVRVGPQPPARAGGQDHPDQASSP